MSGKQLSGLKRWLALDDHRRRLLDGLCDLQRQLEMEAGWFALSARARAEIEQASGLAELDITLGVIHRRLRRWLRAIPTDPADNIAVVTASLQVAERLLPAEENRVVHGLIARAVRDLAALHDPTLRSRGLARPLRRQAARAKEKFADSSNDVGPGVAGRDLDLEAS